jgi:hypothetical protein
MSAAQAPAFGGVTVGRLAALVGGVFLVVCLWTWAKELIDLRYENPMMNVISGGDTSLTATPLDFPIGQVQLKIPRNYFYELPRVAQYYGNDLRLHDSNDKNEVSFAIVVLLPELDPMTAANKTDFHRWSQDQLLVLVMNDSHALTGKPAFDAFYKSKGGDVTTDQTGYNHFTWISGSEGLFKGSAKDPTDFTICSEIGSVPNPSCERYVEIAPRMVMQYSLSRRYLSQMPAIERRIVDLLNSFMIKGSPFEVH